MGRKKTAKTSSSSSPSEPEIEVFDVHSYGATVDVLSDSRSDAVPGQESDATPGKEPSLSQVQDNIVRLLSEKMKETSDRIVENLSALIKKNADEIDALKESSEFLSSEVQDIKKDMTTVRTASKNHEQRIMALEENLNAMERYHRRWNLRLYGLPEQEGEDVRQRMMDICGAVLPGAAEELHYHIDVSHRIGPKAEGKTRPVITRFTTRSTRDAVWRAAKNNNFLKARKLSFGEDLTSKDKETRRILWPIVDEARQRGKKAFFVGAKAFVEGKEVKI